jgi:hypothetical protein
MDKGGMDAYFAGMPNIELEPHQYARRDPRTGKMVRDFSPKYMRNLTILAAAMLSIIWWWREDVTATNLFGITAFVAFCGGVTAAAWLKNIY